MIFGLPGMSCLASIRCHLNGMAMEDGKPKYVTALGECNESRAWSAGRATGGILMDVESNEVVARGLNMPHSPRLHNGKLYVLESGLGQVATIDPADGRKEVIHTLPGFTRGLACIGDYLFIELSKLRAKRSIGGTDPLPVQSKPMQSGLMVIHIPTGAIAGQLQYITAWEEIYDIMVMPDMLRPNVLNHTKEIHSHSLVLPEATF